MKISALLAVLAIFSVGAALTETPTATADHGGTCNIAFELIKQTWALVCTIESGVAHYVLCYLETGPLFWVETCL